MSEPVDPTEGSEKAEKTKEDKSSTNEAESNPDDSNPFREPLLSDSPSEEISEPSPEPNELIDPIELLEPEVPSESPSETEFLSRPDRDPADLPVFDERQLVIMDDDITLMEKVYQLWWRWADFELFIIKPGVEVLAEPIIIHPQLIPNSDKYEYVYPIKDTGYMISTSKASEFYASGLSMCKLFYSIEKVVFILIERLKKAGISQEEEVQIAFAGHELSQRKAFESIINLPFNVVVTNFDPGNWGERYLQNVKRLADKGYGYPAEAPRDNYRVLHSPTKTVGGG